MNKYLLSGGKVIGGNIKIQGAKNSILPVLAAALMCDTPATIINCPDISDVNATFNILRHVGCEITRDGNCVTIDSSSFAPKKIPDLMMREMRSSVILLGAMLAKCGHAEVTFPGGCELGPRPIDLHISAFRRLGVNIVEHGGELVCEAMNLRGADIHLSFPSVGATENVMLLASLCKGKTVIENAAKEPEIEDLQAFLIACGAKISGAGSSRIVIEGVPKLFGCEHKVIADRIVAATYLAASAITGGEIEIEDCEPRHLGAILSVFEQSGCKIICKKDKIALARKGDILPVGTIRSLPYPGFPTDAMAQIMAYLSLAKGNSVFVENIFQNRYKHVGELERMGASIKVHGNIAVVEGVKSLCGANVVSTDLRGGAALVIAGLAAEGQSEIEMIEYIERGYQDFENNLRSLGASIEKIKI